MREWWSKIRATLASRSALSSDLHDEMEAHLELEIEDRIARGAPPGEARADARRHLGNLTGIQERSRESWTFPSLDTLFQDLRYGLRGIRRSPGFALAVILTLALGIGANTAIFSVVNAVLLRPFPYPATERLVILGESDPKAEGISVTWINYQHWRAENHTFEQMAAFQTAHLTLTGRGQALFTRAGLVTSEFFSLVGARPLLGRTFEPAEDRHGVPLTAVLGHEFWAGKLGADPAILGATLALDGKAYRVLGVLPPGIEFFGKPVDLYVPLGTWQSPSVNRASHGSNRLLARLKPGVTLSAALADLDLIMRRLAQADPGPEDHHRAYGEYLADSVTGAVRPALLILLGAVGLVLIIACANVASLVLARATSRAREMAIRAAIGAARLRLVRQLLTENLLLAIFGGLAGLLLARWCLHVLAVLAPLEIPRLQHTSFDWRVWLFAGAATIFTGLLSGFAPVFAAGRAGLAASLKDSARAATGGHRGQQVRSGLVVAEIAMTLVLSFAAGLLIRSLITAQTADPGFAPDRLLALELVLPSSYQDNQAKVAFYTRLAQDLRSLPGVTAVGGVNCPPSAGDCGDWFYSVLDRPAPQLGEVPITLFNTADAGYFAAMRIPLREGRAFNPSDRTGPPVTIVNETLARKWWPNERAIGQRIKFGGPYREGQVFEIVGVAGNVSQMGLDAAPEPEMYLPFVQSPSPAMVLMVRTAADPAPLMPAVRRRVSGIDRNLPIQSLRPFTESLAAPLAKRRFSTLLLASFAALAMLLAAVGVYGLFSYWVRVREDEIAIRLALGAPRRAIFGWAGSRVLRLSLAGAGLGLLAAWPASRWLESEVFGVSPRDAANLIAAAVAVVAMAMVAAALPMWRAARVDAARHLHRA